MNKKDKYEVGQKWLCSDGIIREITGMEGGGYGRYYIDKSWNYIDAYNSSIWDKNKGKYMDVTLSHTVGEVDTEQLSDTDKSKEYFLDNGKLEINNLIWHLAPDHMTLGESDKLANYIYEVLGKKWEND